MTVDAVLNHLFAINGARVPEPPLPFPNLVTRGGDLGLVAFHVTPFWGGIGALPEELG